MTPRALLLCTPLGAAAPPRRCFSSTLHADAWARRRLQWLATGTTLPSRAGSPEHFAAAVDAARAARAAQQASSRPIRIREHSILAALRDPSRLVVFNRPLPLPSLIPILTALWEEEALDAQPPPPR
jgi:hypothetical protein